LNRFKRQLRQSAAGSGEFGSDDFRNSEGGEGGGRDTVGNGRRRRNPFERAVDVGIRLCAGLDWIAQGEDTRKLSDSMKSLASSQSGDAAMQSLGEVERRLRIHWTRIDAEASGGMQCADGESTDEPNDNNAASSLSWIERAWQAGPNGTGIRNSTNRDGSLLRALESMSKCHVFHPELSRPSWKEPCPHTRPGVSLREMARSGMKAALKWQREEYEDGCLPMPKVWEVDEDGWMEVNSLEELEDEMRNLSSSRKGDAESGGTNSERKPRRTTRRSRRKHAMSSFEDAENPDGGDDKQREDMQSLDKMLNGFQSFVEGEGELEGAVTNHDTGAPPSNSSGICSQDNCPREVDLDPEELLSQEVNVDPRKFLDILHAMLSKENIPASANTNRSVLDNEKEDASSITDRDVSKYFFEEDLDDGDMSEDSESGNGNNTYNEENDNHREGY